jgi:hypothetical protein
VPRCAIQQEHRHEYIANRKRDESVGYREKEIADSQDALKKTLVRSLLSVLGIGLALTGQAQSLGLNSSLRASQSG